MSRANLITTSSILLLMLALSAASATSASDNAALWTSAGTAPTALLPASSAFTVTARSARGIISVQWTAAPGYHVYRDTVRIASPGLSAGRVSITRTRLAGYTVTKARFAYCGGPSSGGDLVRLHLFAQGCHADKPEVCYPPQRRVQRLQIPWHAC